MAIDSRMPRDVQEAFNTLLQAELNHEKQMRQARAQQEQEKQLMKLESQKLSNQMFQTTLRGQLETKSLQLKSAQQQSASTLEMHKFLSEQEDKRQMAREREASRQAIEKLKHTQSSKEQAAEHGARMDQILASGGIKSGHIEQETAAKSMLQEGKYDRLEGLARLNNSAELKRLNKKWDLKTKFTEGQNEFEKGQKELDRALRGTLQKNQIASTEKQSKLGRNLRKFLHAENLDFKKLDNKLNRENKLAIAELKVGNTDATKERQVKNLRSLAKTYRIMTAASSGADMMDLTGGKHNNESRAFMKVMAAIDTAASHVEARGGDWREVLNTYLQTNEIKTALSMSSEATAQFKTMQLFLKGGGEMPKIETQAQQGEGVPTEYPPELELEPIPKGGGFGGDAGKQRAYDEME